MIGSGKTAARLAAGALALLVGAGAALLSGGCGRESLSFELRVQHSHYPGFREVHRVRLGEEFQVGDSDYAARVVRFEPDFAMDRKRGEIFSRSDSLNNPAVLVRVKEKGKRKAEIWAFAKAPPHGGGKVPLLFFLDAVDSPGGERLWPAGPAVGEADSTGGAGS